MLAPPKAVMGSLNNADFEKLVESSLIKAKYAIAVDPESAYEILPKRINEKLAEQSELPIETM
ncbi:hypothetical protein AAKU52_000111 [Pedobacter sp. CG_S7]|uniref:helicase HerA-like domain-containing protein n=1 Tax=Pedobacter sp. CG_S7 TaxID=3143930 RepID=UPI003396AF31